MRWIHPGHPGRAVRLAYCLNLHPAASLDELEAGIRAITLPLAARFGAGVHGAPFGIGPWIPGALAARLASPAGAAELARLAEFLAEHGLDAFTWNAFPYGPFHAPGLKERVFAPTWAEPARVEFTLAVARVALACARAHARGEHLSISTHTGAFGARVTGASERRAFAANLARAAAELAELERESGRRIVLALEPEPRASAGDTRELARFHALVRETGTAVLRDERGLARDAAAAVLARHLGTCLDACHAAVEFEPAEPALANATDGGATLGKLQFSSALRLPRPDDDAAGRARLLALDEPVYLHQVTGLRGSERVPATDLPEVAAAWQAGDPRWRGHAEWRCHFHVPVHLAGDLGAGGLTTTLPLADELLGHALAAPERWGAAELHLEIETYTWNLLPGELRRGAALLDGLAGEYEHVMAQLSAAGWSRAEPAHATR